MDYATKLFSITLGVQPNKKTLKELSGTLNSAVLTLAEKQKALEYYAETAQDKEYVIEAPKEPPKPPVVWQISQSKIQELKWKRAQLRQFEREKAAGRGENNKSTAAATPQTAPKSAEGKRAPPKLSSSSSSSVAPAAKQAGPQGTKGTVARKKPQEANPSKETKSPPKLANPSKEISSTKKLNSPKKPKAKPAPELTQTSKSKKA